jgi:metal-dependent amidase/aminoacylase/carboxypeptidase family protein
MGGKCEFEVMKGYPFLVNDAETTERARKAAVDLLGEEKVVDLDMRMTAEDFAYYSQEIPACFYRLGTAGPNGSFTNGVHHPRFDIDENALITGSSLMAWMAVSQMWA